MRAAVFEGAGPTWGASELRSMRTDTVGLEALPEAFEALRRPNKHCKLMVDPWA